MKDSFKKDSNSNTNYPTTIFGGPDIREENTRIGSTEILPDFQGIPEKSDARQRLMLSSLALLTSM